MTWDDALRAHVRRMAREDLDLRLGPPDEDGDWLVDSDGVPVVLALLPGDPVLLRAWTSAAQRVPRTAKVLREVNDANVALRVARLLWVDGMVVASAEVPAAALSPGVLAQLVGRVAGVARDVGPLLAVVHGGVVPWVEPPAEPVPSDEGGRQSQ